MNLWTCNDFITLCLLFFRQLALSMESEASNPVAVAPPLDLHTTPVRVARKKQAVKKITSILHLWSCTLIGFVWHVWHFCVSDGTWHFELCLRLATMEPCCMLPIIAVKPLGDGQCHFVYFQCHMLNVYFLQMHHIRGYAVKILRK